VTIALSAVLLASCDGKNEYVAPPPKVIMAKPTIETVTDNLEFTGNTATFETQAGGARRSYLQKTHFRDGQRVDKGDLLFTSSKISTENVERRRVTSTRQR
jgi:multidrug efflux pump subunit AcrA (membrane-fusion protein)